jgi:hypothetical protein
LCRRHNTKLGIEYDPTLISLASELRRYVESKLHLPLTVNISVKANRLIRCIVGHLLAHGLNEHRNGLANTDLTDFFLNPKTQFPKNIRVYYWLYPYDDQLVVKGAALSLDLLNTFAVVMLLKFFSISFFFVIDEPTTWQIRYRRLDTLSTEAIDDEAIFSIDTFDIPPQRFPEAPGPAGVILFSEEAATGVVARNLKK